MSARESGKASELLPEVVEKNVRDFEQNCLVLHMGSFHVRSLYTGDRLPSNRVSLYRQEIIMAANNLFSSAVRGLKSSISLKKVILMKLPLNENLPQSLKSTLSLLFNETLINLWIQSPFKEDIIIGDTSFER